MFPLIPYTIAPELYTAHRHTHMSLHTCYNRGCTQKFLEEDNDLTACKFHPGVPVFHEGLKGWSCCSRRTTNFSDFLEFPGCERGPHNPFKPAPPKKQEMEELPPGKDPIVMSEQRAAPPIPAPRPTAPAILLSLPAKVDQPLLKALELSKHSETADPAENKTQRCQNGGCQALRRDGEEFDGDCVYHSGNAIFHEGLKYWSCCSKKTTVFEEFIAQPGCTMGTHKWVFSLNPSASQIKFDHFQRGTNLVITFYGKLCDYCKCTVKASSTNLQINLTFEGGKKVIERLFELYSTVIPEKSAVEYYQNKVEVLLYKNAKFHWPQLEYPMEELMALENTEDTSESL